ncbi:MAG: hypothetical protein K9I34_00345 [Bacteroidales bacterium]|nr:hypothetical protein [Bacteroidales bacterium]
MNYFNNTKIYKWIILLLIVINVISIGSIWMFYPRLNPIQPLNQPNPSQEPPAILERNTRFLINELDLNDEQVQLFKEERISHFSSMRSLRDSISFENEHIFNLIFDQPEDSQQIHLRHEKIIQYHNQIEKLKLNHFLRLASYCDETQKERLRGLFDEMFIQERRSGRPDSPKAFRNRHDNRENRQNRPNRNKLN